ncbi:MAG: IstB-like binding protein [Pseudomonadota bacterium]|jgi:hypothetical protein
MNIEELDQRLAALPAGGPPREVLTDRVTSRALAAVTRSLRIVPPPTEAGAEAARAAAQKAAHEARLRQQAARRALEPRVRDPRLLAALQLADTRCALLLGPTGIGKTSAARWARIRHGGCWIRAIDLGSCERRHTLGHGKPPLLDRAVDAPVLYLDDLGTEDSRDVGVLQDVIDQRYSAQPPRATFVTTGLTLDGLRAHLGAPTVRRLLEQHVPKPGSGTWPVLCVDSHGGARG